MTGTSFKLYLQLQIKTAWCISTFSIKSHGFEGLHTVHESNYCKNMPCLTEGGLSVTQIFPAELLKQALLNHL